MRPIEHRSERSAVPTVQRTPRRPAFLLGPLLLVAPLGASVQAQGHTWFVDDNGGPGVDFTSIQAAIDAAAPADTLLVGPGKYASFVVEKSLSIVGAGKDLVDVGPGATGVPGVAVRNTPAGAQVLLAGLDLHANGLNGFPPLYDSIPAYGFEVTNAHGIVTLSDVRALGGTDPASPMTGGHVLTSELVLLFDSEINGSTSPSNKSGLWVEDSAVWICGSTVRGGSGGVGAGCAGSSGSSAVRVDDSTLYVARSTISGGSGGYGGYCPLGIKQVGSGGAGIYATGAALLKLVDGSVRGGSSPSVGGCLSGGGVGASALVLNDTSSGLVDASVALTGGANPGCPASSAPNIVLGAGAQLYTTDFPYPILQAVPALAALGTSVSIALEGEAGSLAVFAASTGFAAAFSPAGFDGATVLDLGQLVWLQGTLLSAAGVSTVSLSVPNDSALQGVRLNLQGAVLGASGYALSNPDLIAVVN
jgi:hypothetical protein